MATEERQLTERDVSFTTLSGEPIRALYTEADLPADLEASIGLPGGYPYPRGVYPSMSRGRLWTMRQFAGFGTAEETNERFRYLLGHGQDGLSTAFDMPSLMGYDSDHPLSLGEVGREGVAVDTLDDMRTLFDGIDLGEISVSLTIKDGLTYVEQAVARGLNVDDFAPRLSFFFNAQIDFFEEVAKYRAARRIWARELRDRYGARNERSWLMRTHVQTAGVSLTAQQPLNNVIRTTTEALAAVLGGT